MCGIAGVYNVDGRPVVAGVVKAMTDSLRHRGPDGEGLYVDGPIGLGHRRLAIIDLSPAGHQPMANETGDVVITYNGETYNFQKLRVQLEALGHQFHSQSDTEVVVHAYEMWGEDCVNHFNGMFAFAIWDARRRCLFLARDRYGIKPLYYLQVGHTFLFASEIKALLRHPAVQADVCYEALSEYFTFQNILTDLTLFQGVRLLPPGCCLRVDAHSVRQTRYWDYQFDTTDFALSQEEATETLYQLFEQAVVRQLVSDVPVGSYLSGGMDSGSITAVAARHIHRLSTFTGGFDLSSASGLELGFDERAASEIMANLFKTEHYEIVLHAGDMEYVLPSLIWHLEDLRVGQCYPNYYVARLAGRFVKVVLSGGGGDELFAGYPWRYYRGLNSHGATDYYRRYYEYWQRLIPDETRPYFFNERTYKHLRHYESFAAFRDVFNGHQPQLHCPDDYVNASLYFEAKTFLHGLFVVEDKVSMAHALETRVPFMDNDLVDFSLRLPPHFKLRNLREAPVVDEDEQGKLPRYQRTPSSDGKLMLRNAMSRLIPADVLTRAKQGFSAPDASWFRGESIDYINRFLRDPKACLYEYLHPTYVHKILDEHSTGQHNHRLLIWSLLSFEWWCRLFLEGRKGPEATDTVVSPPRALRY
jgi:asparagine synthase (glutamine-hydrolysing)